MKCILRVRVCEAIKTGEGMKTGTTMQLLGADWLFVRQRLESMFSGDMSWDNHGTVWHIDHHIPCVAWDLKNAHHQRACFNWRNLRPLERMSNFKKSGFMPDGWQDFMAMLLRETA